jgi:hypothetical protein
MAGIDPDRVARRAVRELRVGRGRTVAMPRVLGLARLLGLPPLAQLVDVGTRAVSASLARSGPEVAKARAPAAAHSEGDIRSERGLGTAP